MTAIERHQQTIDQLAIILIASIDRAEPSVDPQDYEWEKMPESDRNYYRTRVKDLLLRRDLVESYYTDGRRPTTI